MTLNQLYKKYGKRFGDTEIEIEVRNAENLRKSEIVDLENSELWYFKTAQNKFRMTLNLKDNILAKRRGSK